MVAFKVDADVAQQILSTLIEVKEAVAVLTQKVDALIERVDALEVRVDSLETNLNEFKKEVKVEFKVLGERVGIVEKKVTLIESRQIDVEQKLIAMDIHTESRFLAFEVILDKNTDSKSAKNKSISKPTAGGRISG
jgi:hypothetical protein